jgi:hypothetical protein
MLFFGYVAQPARANLLADRILVLFVSKRRPSISLECVLIQFSTSIVPRILAAPEGGS